MKTHELIQFLESIAPPAYQESYDNSGLLVGDANADIQGVLLCLDCTEAVIEEAVARGCNVVVAHHPIIFGGLKRLTGRNYVERTVIAAIRHGIAIYAIHTNLDNVYRQGVNAKIAERLGLERTRILAPKKGVLKKLYTYIPHNSVEAVRQAVFAAGAGQIGNYSECSFGVSGTGTFNGNEASNPAVGERGNRHHEPEEKVEFLFPTHLESAVLRALRQSHPYEEVAYEIISLDNLHQEIGAGLVGELPAPMPTLEFLHWLKERMQTGCVRYTPIARENVQRIALCGGSGSFLLRDALRAQADVFITGDFKYHEFFDAEGQIVIADIGHYESEQFTIELFYELISKKFSSFALYSTQTRTNPVNYL